MFSINELVIKINDTFNSGKQEICDELSKIENDPGVKQLSSLCFSVNFSKLESSILSADYYSNINQAAFLKELVTSSNNPEILANHFAEIVKTGRARSSKISHIMFNKTLRDFVKTLL